MTDFLQSAAWLVWRFFELVMVLFLVLGPLVLIHEFGHFIVARWLRIGVPVFSIGFGPRLFGITRGGTDYRFSAIPLGGYVRLTGDEADELRTGRPEEFLTRPKWQRFLVFVAGATFNLILAFVVVWMLIWVNGIEELPNPDPYPTVAVLERGGVAERAGVKLGDVLIEIGGKDLRGPERFMDVRNLEIALAPDATKAVVVERAGRRVELEITIEAHPVEGYGLSPGWGLSWGSDATPIITDVLADGRAAAAGMREGDRVLAAGELDPISEVELRSLLAASAEKPLDLVLERDGERLEVTVVPAKVDGAGRIGVGLGLETVRREFGLFEAARQSWRQNVKNSYMLAQVLKRLFTNELSIRSVSGPIGIARYAREALWTSWTDFLVLLGFFSLQLGILNLLPIPVLDGGHILILAIEGVIGRELSDRWKERAMQMGFVFLLAVMGTVIFLDVGKLL